MISMLPKPPPFPCLCPQSKMISLYYRLQTGAVNTLPLGHTHSRGMHLNGRMQCNIQLSCVSIHRALATAWKSAISCDNSAILLILPCAVSLLTVRLMIEASYLVTQRHDPKHERLQRVGSEYGERSVCASSTCPRLRLLLFIFSVTHSFKLPW